MTLLGQKKGDVITIPLRATQSLADDWFRSVRTFRLAINLAGLNLTQTISENLSTKLAPFQGAFLFFKYSDKGKYSK